MHRKSLYWPCTYLNPIDVQAKERSLKSDTPIPLWYPKVLGCFLGQMDCLNIKQLFPQLVSCLTPTGAQAEERALKSYAPLACSLTPLLAF